MSTVHLRIHGSQNVYGRYIPQEQGFQQAVSAGGAWTGQDPKVMMLGIVSRLTDQKGFDLIDYVMDELCRMQYRL